jgi:stage IV sporulation protein FB
MLGPPPPTPYDLRFRFFGFPVRVHPLFWLVTALLGYNRDDPRTTLIWVACVFVSILIHEFGHGFVARAYGARPLLILYGMGGLCVYDNYQPPRKRLAVLFWGPGAGFVLCALILLAVSLRYGLNPIEAISLLLYRMGIQLDVFGVANEKFSASPYLRLAVFQLLFINFWWGLVNLFPIWPLDGGQMLGEGLSLVGASQPMRRTHITGMLLSGLLAVVIFYKVEDVFMTLFFAYFAFANYQMLQQYSGAYRYSGDDADWWKR